MRKSVGIIVLPDKIHFRSGPLQGLYSNGHGQFVGHDIWFPFNGDLFNSVETIMVANNIAHNVVSISRIQQCGLSIDYEVIYNVRKVDEAPNKSG
jgi:hypothetical protein